MKKYLDIKGRSVVDPQGVLLGSVEDCIFDSRGNRLCSLIINSGRLFSASSILPLSCISKLGSTIIYSGGAFKCRKKKMFMNRIITLNEVLGKQVISFEGENEGKLADFIIDEDTWDIIAFICSRGLIEDLIGGRRLVLMNERTTFMNDRIIVYKNDIKPLSTSSINRYLGRN